MWKGWIVLWAGGLYFRELCGLGAVLDGLSLKKAEEFVNAKTVWITKNLNKMRQCELEHKAITENSIDIDKAKSKLTKRLKEPAKKHGFICNRVSSRNQ